MSLATISLIIYFVFLPVFWIFFLWIDHKPDFQVQTGVPGIVPRWAWFGAASFFWPLISIIALVAMIIQRFEPEPDEEDDYFDGLYNQYDDDDDESDDHITTHEAGNENI